MKLTLSYWIYAIQHSALPRFGIWAGHPKSFIPEAITNRSLSTLCVSA